MEPKRLCEAVGALLDPGRTGTVPCGLKSVHAAPDRPVGVWTIPEDEDGGAHMSRRPEMEVPRARNGNGSLKGGI